MLEKQIDYRDPQSLGSKLRAKRVGPLLELISNVSGEKDVVQILDVGGTRNYWNIVPEAFLVEHRVRVTLLNLPGIGQESNQGCFSHLAGDGCSSVLQRLPILPAQ